MEILILVLLYYLSQNPAFTESVKPLMNQIKDSQQMLNFLNDLSKFSQTFGGFTGENTEPKQDEPKKEKEENKKSPQSPTQGIADEFIQNILESYLKKN